MTNYSDSIKLYYDVIAIKMDIAEYDLENIIIINIKDNKELD